jgi:hypothetical protein
VNTSSLAINSYIRARGFHSGGRWNGSLSLIEDTAQVTPQTRPVILSNDDSFGFQTNHFGFTVRALPGQAIVIEATTDFLTWTPIQTNLVTDLAQFSFTDSQSDALPQRFYRARVHSGQLPVPAIKTSSGSLGFRGTDFAFSVLGTPGQTVIIEASTNLQDWLPLQTNLLSPTPLLITDSTATNFTYRFYRARP